MKTLTKLLLLFLACSGQSLEKLLPSGIPMQMAKQVNTYTQFTRPKNPYTTCNLFILSDGQWCEDVWSAFLKESKCAKHISTRFNVSHIEDTHSTVTFLIIQNENFTDYFQRFIQSKYFSNKGNYKFAVCSPVSDQKLILNICQQIWKNRMANFVILYWNATLKFASYNPFNQQLHIMDAILKRSPEFPDSLRDMQGYPLRILEIPRYVKFSIEYSYSFDTNFLYALKKCMNVTVIGVIISKDQSTLSTLHLRLSTEDVEVVPFTQAVGFHWGPNHPSQSVTYLSIYTMNNIVALVPNPKQISQLHFFFTMLLVVVIPLLLSISFMMASLDKFASPTRKTRKLDLMGFLAVCFKSSLPHFSQIKSPLRIVWLLSCVLMGIFYDILALNFALVPRYEKAISSLSDLRASNLPIFSIDFPLPPEYNVTRLGKTAWRDKIQANKGDAAFIGAQETFDKIAKWHANTRRPYNYRTLEEVVVPAYGAFLSKAKSPYSHKLEQIILRVTQMGASVEVPYRYKKDQLTRESNQFLVFKDFLGIFAVWMTGMCIASLVFFLEIACRKLKVFHSFASMPSV